MNGVGDAEDADDTLRRLSRLARAERGVLAGIARAEGATPEDAVDCVQEGLCTLLGMARRAALPDGELAQSAARSAPDGEPAQSAARSSDWGPLLATIVRNVARNRRRRHFRAMPHDSFDDEAAVDRSDAGAEEAIARAEDHVRLRACVDELCEIQKAVVTLRMLEEQPGEDVAAALGITPGYVAVLLLRAKRSLRVCMAPARVE